MKKYLITLLVAFFTMNSWAQDFYQFKYKDTSGKEIDFKEFKGKVVMITNIATRCGFTGQLDDLEKLFLKYKDRNFTIIAFPSNNFMSQTPEGNKEVAEFCRLKYGVSFPIIEKQEVIGKQITPLFKWFTEQKGYDGAVLWNFEKFIINKEGKIIDRFRSMTNPMDADILKVLDKETK